MANTLSAVQRARHERVQNVAVYALLGAASGSVSTIFQWYYAALSLGRRCGGAGSPAPGAG